MPRWSLLAFSLLLACSTFGDPASSSTGGQAGQSGAVCTPGKQEACVCPGGSTGAQACRDDGRGFLPCQCGTGGNADAGQGGTTAGGAPAGGRAGQAGSGGTPTGGQAGQGGVPAGQGGQGGTTFGAGGMAGAVSGSSGQGGGPGAGASGTAGAGGQAGLSGSSGQGGQAGETDCATNYYFDSDGDGFGNFFQSLYLCSAPQGWVLNSLDCDDTNAKVNPAQTQYFSVGYPDPVAPGGVSFDYDCDGQESKGDVMLAKNCSLLDPLQCTGEGYAITARAGLGIDPYCGSTEVVVCKSSILVCSSEALKAEPVACR